MSVEIFEIVQGKEQALWLGNLVHLPRVGEVVYINLLDPVRYVDNVEHFLVDEIVKVRVRRMS